ncbi:hypothetical protein V496_01331 [Pseudogymnoascus sp. VKM F-4515 (FW-2607)]|nr:hypothetical protein V496_01331 [Pseudogymnoascus sp. VKM F-4515 (FW-2607)]
MHLDTTKQAVESAKTEILEGVDKAGNGAEAISSALEKTVRTLLADVPTTSGLRSLLERRPEEGSGRLKNSFAASWRRHSSPTFRPPPEENPRIIEKLVAFIKGHKKQEELEHKISALKGDLREALLIQDKKLLEQKLDFQQEMTKEGTGNLRGLHQEQQLVQKWAIQNAHLQQSLLNVRKKIEGLEALVLSADACMRTEREQLLKDYSKELGRVEAQLAAAADKIRGLETTAATADPRRKELVAAATTACENLLKDHGRETGKLEAKIEAAQEKFDTEKKKLEGGMDALRGLLQEAEAKLEQAEAQRLEEAEKAEARRIQDVNQQLEEATANNSEDIVELEKNAEEVAKTKEQLAQEAEASRKQFEEEVAAGKKILEQAEAKNSDDIGELKQQLEQEVAAGKKRLKEEMARGAADASELRKQLEEDAAAGKKKLEDEARDLMKKLEDEKAKSAADASELKKQLEQQAEDLAKKLEEEKAKSATDASELRKLLEQQAEAAEKKLDQEKAKRAADASELLLQLEQLEARRSKEASGISDYKALWDRLHRVEGWHKKDVEIAKKKLKDAKTVEANLREQLKQAQLQTAENADPDAAAAKKAEDMRERLGAAEADATAAKNAETELRGKLDAAKTDLRARLKQAGTDSETLRAKLDVIGFYSNRQVG